MCGPVHFPPVGLPWWRCHRPGVWVMVGGEARVPGDPARAVCSVLTVTSVCWTEIHLPDMCYICIRNHSMLPNAHFATASTEPGTVWWCIWVAIIGREILLVWAVLCHQLGKGGKQINLIWDCHWLCEVPSCGFGASFSTVVFKLLVTVEHVWLKLEFLWNPCKVKVYFLGAKMKWNRTS